MSMSREAVRETWTKRVERWRQSGLSYAAYSREHGLSEKSLRWWRIRLDEEAAEAAAPPSTVAAPPKTLAPPKTARLRRAPSKTSPLTFIEVSAKPVEAAIELVVAACVVRVAPGFDTVTLGRVIDVLKERA